MAQASESQRDAAQMWGALRDGMETLDLNSEVTFTEYSRVILPVDGYIFWQPLVPIVRKGSLHVSQEIQQSDDETVGFATVLFTSEKRIVEFTDAPINRIYIAACGPFAMPSPSSKDFSAPRAWHYFGHSIYPAMETQLLDNPGAIDFKRAVTSNSIALWLALSTYQTPFPDWFANSVPLYPSKLVSPNLIPPYAAVHIHETRTLQARFLNAERDHYQLCADRCRVTLYGLQSDEALDFFDCILQYSVYSENFGIMNMPAVIDGKREQSELQTIAMQKVIDFEISYNQARVAQVARTLIIKAVSPTLYLGKP